MSETSITASQADMKNATTSADTSAIVHERENLSNAGRFAGAPAEESFSVAIVTQIAYAEGPGRARPVRLKSAETYR